MTQRWWRTIRAELRDIRVLLLESWPSLLLFIIILAGGALAFKYFYADLEPGQHLSFGEALYATFSLIFFNPYLPFPQQSHWFLQLIYFVVPVVGLAAIVDGVLRFGVALVSKRGRGQKWQVAMASTYSNHVIVCGIGKVGYRVVLELLKFGREVVAIELDPDGRRSGNLIKAGVEKADAIIPCTDDELTNLDIALDAREINPEIKVVMRMFDPDLARRIQKGFDIHTAYSTSALAAPIFAAASMQFNVKHSFYVGDTLLNLSEIDVEPGSGLAGWSLEKLQSELDVLVVCHQAGECTKLKPEPSLELRAGDRILVMASLDTLHELTNLNG
jgi:voltage-gated potassium channel